MSIQKHGDAHIVSFTTPTEERTYLIRELSHVRIVATGSVCGPKFTVCFTDASGTMGVDFYPETDARAFHADLCEVMRAQAIRAEIRESREPRVAEAFAELEKPWAEKVAKAESAHDRLFRRAIDVALALGDAKKMVRRLADALERLDYTPNYSDLIAEARAMGGKADMDAAVEEDR